MLSVTSASPAASTAAAASRDFVEADSRLRDAEDQASVSHAIMAHYATCDVAEAGSLSEAEGLARARIKAAAAKNFDMLASCVVVADAMRDIALATAGIAYPPIVGSPATRAVRAEKTGKHCGGYSESVIGALYEYFKSIGALDDVSKIADLYNHIRENVCTVKQHNLVGMAIHTETCTKTEPCVGRNHDKCSRASLIGTIAQKFPKRLYDTDKAVETTKKYIFFIWVLLSGLPICEVPCGIRRSIARRQHHEST